MNSVSRPRRPAARARSAMACTSAVKDVPRHCATLPTHREPREDSRRARAQPISTGVPTGTRGYRSITSGTVIRMQPCEAREPIEPDSAVPWIPTPLTMPIQRALSGLAAEPPGPDSLRSAPAHGLFGTVHVGLTALLVIEK